jgi:nitrogen regulatory protein P-II 2
MPARPLTLVTIIVEVVLEDRLLRDLKALGLPGYTRSEVRGEGRRHVRDPWEGNNVRLELLVAPALAERIIALLEEKYLPNYALVAWTSDVRAYFAESQIRNGE